MLSNLNKHAPPKKTLVQQPSPVVVRPEKVVVVIQDRSGSMAFFIKNLDDQLRKRELGNQYIFFANYVQRRDSMHPVDVGGGTNIFPAFEELFKYLKDALPKKVDIVFVSDGEDNNMLGCRKDFATHLGKFQIEFPDIQEHRFFTIGVGSEFPVNLVSNARNTF